MGKTVKISLGEAIVRYLDNQDVSLDGKEYYTGYTKEYIKGALPANQDYTNQCQRGVLGKKIGEHLYLLENH